MKYKIKNVHKTLFIKERYQILSERNDNSLNNFSLNNWRSTMSIISEKTFEEMLKLNNYNKKIFSNTVNYDYTEEQIRLYSEYAKNSEWYKFAEGSFEIFRKHPQRINFKKDFSRILEPFIINLLKLINNYLENKEYEWIDKNGNIFSSLVFYLEDLIYPWIVKPLVLEINSLREKGLLEGESEQQRYKYFITLFDKEENILNFYNKYPVLLRQISESCLRFYTYFIEILSNLENDFSVLEEELGLRGKLNDIKFGKGDTHSQGKTVLILFFDDAKIVYKPKNLIINNSLNTIAEYIRKVDEKIRIRIPRTIAYSDHSYEEFIDYLPLEQKKKLPEYYYNFGVLLAFIYLFNGSDIHFENLISESLNKRSAEGMKCPLSILLIWLCSQIPSARVCWESLNSFLFNLNFSASVFIKDNKPSYLLNFIIKFLVQNSKLKKQIILYGNNKKKSSKCNKNTWLNKIYLLE
ncbi:lantibiotic modifying enzyme [Streptococcus pneumoniae]|nr:lantibiotic modifying enzyme [Streptococcus pneumoniae]